MARLWAAARLAASTAAAVRPRVHQEAEYYGARTDRCEPRGGPQPPARPDRRGGPETHRPRERAAGLRRVSHPDRPLVQRALGLLPRRALRPHARPVATPGRGARQPRPLRPLRPGELPTLPR